MKYHIEPIQWIVRGYKEGSYEERTPYDYVVSLFKISDTEVYGYAQHGTLDAGIRDAIKEMAEKYGITKVHLKHKGNARAIYEKREA